MDRKAPLVVVITGASAGIGRATAVRFARDGAKVALLARGMDGLHGAKRDVEAAGGQALIIPTDVSDPAAVEAAAEQVERELGPIDVWINNAMASVFSPASEIPPEEYKRVTEVTYLGQVYGTMAALRRMRPRNKGSIVLVGSALAYRGIPLQSPYCAAKHAVQGFFDSLRCELLHEKSDINLSMVQLPGVNTPQFEWVKSRLPQKPRPIGAIYQPEIAAEALHWSATHHRRELIVGMPAVKAIIGNEIAPQYADWVLGKTGFKSQQRPEPDDPNRPNNLWEPVPGDHGIHGPFDKEAREVSPQLWSTTHRKTLGGVALALGALGMVLFARQRKADRSIVSRWSRYARRFAR